MLACQQRLEPRTFPGLREADQWDVPWRAFQTGGLSSHALLTHLHQVILEAVEKRLLFPGVDVMTVLGERDCLQTRHISAIESDEAGEYGATWAVFEELGLEGEATTTDCRVVRLGWAAFPL